MIFIVWSLISEYFVLYRYPVIVLRFHLNPGTGGDGFHKGGDGVIRELLFRRTQVLSVLCERRSAFQPYGLRGKQEVLKKIYDCLFVCLLDICRWERRLSYILAELVEEDSTTLTIYNVMTNT